VEASHQLILLGSVLVLLSIFAGLFSARAGAPLLLVFLGLGMLAGGEGPGGIVFRDFHAAYLIGSISLAIILFDGGLRTDPGAIRRALWPSLALATVGVIATAALVGAAAALLFSTSWIRGFLVGVIIAPTDAAAVSALLHLRGLELRARVAGTLELESGINDPLSVLLTVLLVSLLLAPAPLTGSHIAALLAREVVGGSAFGIGGGYLLLALINRVEEHGTHGEPGRSTESSATSPRFQNDGVGIQSGELRLVLLLSVASSRSGAASHATSILSFRTGSLSWMRQRRGTEPVSPAREDDQGGTRSHSGLFTA
jgi:NhaP-type Na+/H+ and K+/H+ antiporter